jgi:hypothetical protein
MALQNVCVVSTIPFANTNLETHFKSGLGNTGTYKTPQDNIGYDLQALKTAVQTAGADNNTLVVTVGGLMAAIAADQVGTVPFISLAGGTAGFHGTPAGKFLGGTCLDAYSHNIDRINYLKGRVPLDSADQVCLLYNSKNSAFAGPETNIFTYTQPADLDPSNVVNAANVYDAAFTAIGKITDDNGNLPGIEAIVISADSFFTQTKEQLKSVASNYPYYVSYPLKEYKSGASPKRNHSTIHAPRDSLSSMYKKMGQKAKAVLTSQAVTWEHEFLDSPDDIT